MMGEYALQESIASLHAWSEMSSVSITHIDTSVYEAMVRMAQDFSLRYPLVDGQGNFGSMDGDSAAAMRYTEVKMAKLGELMLADIDKDTVDWRDNYDASTKEPSVLPTRIPNLLLN